MGVTRGLAFVLCSLIAACAGPTPPVPEFASPSSTDQPAKSPTNPTASPTPGGSSASPTASATAYPSTVASAREAADDLVALAATEYVDAIAAYDRYRSVSVGCAVRPPCSAEELDVARGYWAALAAAVRRYVQGRDAIVFPERFAARADAEKDAARTFWRRAREAAAATSHDQFNARVALALKAGRAWGDRLQRLKDELGKALGVTYGP